MGLTTRLFLHQLGVPAVMIEKELTFSPLPRSRGIHVRSMEIFRQLGVEENVKQAVAAAWQQGGFGGARRGTSVLQSEPVQPGMALIMAMKKSDPTPSAFGACPQTTLEPLLHSAVEERGGEVRWGCELVGFNDTGSAVEATIRDKEGKESSITASYLIGADGGRSFVRRQLNIDSKRTPAKFHYLNCYFQADLTTQVKERTFSQCQVHNDRASGLITSMNNTTLWSFHLEYDPAKDKPADWSAEHVRELICTAIGTSDVPIELLVKPTTWSDVVRVADRYRVGRVFLVGDAAHQWPPWGGFGANTGIADAQNLTWKLAKTLAGDAKPDLLDTYESERRPVALRCGEQALLRTDFEARFGAETATNKEDLKRQIDINAVIMRYQYSTPAQQGDSRGQMTEHVDQLRAQTGTRFPHAWITHKSERRSTLDLFDNTAYVLVAGPKAVAERWRGDGSAQCYVMGADFELAEGEKGWTELTGGLADDGAVLVRPDGFVADRSDETLQPKTVQAAA